MANLECVIVTPEKKVLQEPADAVIVPLFDGELGVFPQHAPLIGRLGAGEVRVRSGDDVKRFYVEGGIVEVFGKTVSIITTRAMKGSEIAPDKIHDELGRLATERVVGEESLEKRQHEYHRLKAMLRVARRSHRS
ncbi:MAG TPA: ATP synthase F1 subunit epsilon [Thermogutta sp.]|nr:ATP synthase F1 subunit epsilon [Thermogutta sp.]